MNIKKLFPSKYVTAADLGDRRYTLKMRTVKVEKLGQPVEEKPVLYFIGAEKGLILNRTNAMAIAEAYGEETDFWNGKPIELFVANVKAFGKWQPAVRVSVPGGSPSGAPVEQPLDDVEDVVDDDPDLWAKPG